MMKANTKFAVSCFCVFVANVMLVSVPGEYRQVMSQIKNELGRRNPGSPKYFHAKRILEGNDETVDRAVERILGDSIFLANEWKVNMDIKEETWELVKYYSQETNRQTNHQLITNKQLDTFLPY